MMVMLQTSDHFFIGDVEGSWYIVWFESRMLYEVGLIFNMSAESQLLPLS